MLAYVNAIDFENDAIIAIAQIIFFDCLFVFIKVYTILSQFENKLEAWAWCLKMASQCPL